MKRVIQTADAPAAVGPYSQAVVAGAFVYTSGQIALVDGKLLAGSIADETTQVMRNLQAILRAAGADFADVVKTTIYLTDISTFAEVNAAYSDCLQQPYPARETVGVQALPLDARVEISIVAQLS